MDASRALRGSPLSLSMRSPSPSDSLASFHSDGAADLDRYASTLLAKCDSLMKQYEERQVARTQVEDDATQEISQGKPHLADHRGDLEEMRPPTHRSFEVTPSPSRANWQTLQRSAETVFPLYLSSSDDSSVMKSLDAWAVSSSSSAAAKMRQHPLNESDVAPFQGDEVVRLLWQRLKLVRGEIAREKNVSELR